MRAIGVPSFMKIAALAVAALTAGTAAQDLLEGPVPQTGRSDVLENVRLEPVVSGLEHPWGVAWLPDRRMLITERPGRLRMVRAGERPRGEVRGLPHIFAFGQGGLMDVALHPDYASNRYVYLTYSTGDRDANRTVVGRGRLSGNELIGFREIFSVAQDKNGGQHFGSRILWLPDATFLLAVGDGGNPPTKYDGDFIREQAQNTATHLGKVLRLNDDGSAPDDNPFARDPDADPYVWSLGHRNIQGLARDPDSGVIYANEHGARGGDELNILEPGVNYGWPTVTYSREYRGPRITDRTAAPRFRNPVVVWTPSKAPCGLAFYTGDRYPQWQGDLFSGALAHQHVRRIDLDDEGNVVGQQELRTGGRRVRDVRQGPDGFLYVLTDRADGELLRVVLEPEN